MTATTHTPQPAGNAAIKPPPNWCRTCGKHRDDPKAVFCSDSIHIPPKELARAIQAGKGEDELAAFESWARRNYPDPTGEVFSRIEGRPTNKLGYNWEYNGNAVQCAFDAWVERAALAGSQDQPFRTMPDGASFEEYRDQLAVGGLTPVDQIAFDNILHNRLAEMGKWPARFACNGPEGSFWTDDSTLANKLIAATYGRDEWTVTDTENPTGGSQGEVVGDTDGVLLCARHGLNYSQGCADCEQDIETFVDSVLPYGEPPATTPDPAAPDGDGDWYTDPDSGSHIVDISTDGNRQLALILKPDRTIRFAAYVDGVRTVGDAMGESFVETVRSWAALSNPRVSEAVGFVDLADLPTPGCGWSRAGIYPMDRMGKDGAPKNFVVLYTSPVAAIPDGMVVQALTDPENQPSQWGTIPLSILPERMNDERDAFPIGEPDYEDGFARGWNACLDRIAAAPGSAEGW